MSRAELWQLLHAAEVLKKIRGDENSPQPLRGQSLALIFEKPSLRTRVSFTVGIQELGGGVFELLGAQMKNEDPEDSIRVLQGMVHGIMLRTFEHSKLERMLSKSRIPIINGLSDSHHPCQALADLMTIKERLGHLSGIKIAYLGDGNNVLHSLMLMAPFLGMELHYACPENYQPNPEILARAEKRAFNGKGKIRKFTDPLEAAAGVHVLYTDVWTSMGQEAENSERSQVFQRYQVNLEMLAEAHPSAIVLHCLPMVKGQEITAEVVEHPASALFEQAENRLHAQKALMLGLFQGRLNR